MADCNKCGTKLVEGALYCHMCGKKQTPAQRKPLRRPNGMGSVYRISGRRKKPWGAAKGGVFIGTFATKTEALAALEKLTGKLLPEKYNMTFAEVFEEWKAEHYREIGAKGVESYDNAFRVCAPLHDMKFRDIRTKDFQSVIDANEKKSHSTLSKYKQLMTQMSTWAKREEIITTSFAGYVKLPAPVKKEKETFTDKEIQKLEKDNSDAAKIVLMLIYTGMRINELFTLPLSDYHETYVIGGEKTEAGKGRIIPIRPEGRGYFQYFADRATGELLLSGYEGQRVAENFRNRDYYPLLKRLKIDKKKPHSTRHTYASWARKNGIQPEVLQKILGHADYSTTANIYVHIDPADLVKAVETGSSLLAAEKT